MAIVESYIHELDIVSIQRVVIYYAKNLFNVWKLAIFAGTTMGNVTATMDSTISNVYECPKVTHQRDCTLNIYQITFTIWSLLCILVNILFMFLLSARGLKEPLYFILLACVSVNKFVDTYYLIVDRVWRILNQIARCLT
ncbi:hypothetical protein QE152_g13807 [Popillia japonica]|uniref:Uncharacterized protein n=1 Tax=Popillia japonica TaxID=7064 RepID=A0AAW1L8Z8_POPJA